MQTAKYKITTWNRIDFTQSSEYFGTRVEFLTMLNRMAEQNDSPVRNSVEWLAGAGKGGNENMFSVSSACLAVDVEFCKFGHIVNRRSA